MTHDLAGDVKRLTHSTPEYRLRVGKWRAAGWSFTGFCTGARPIAIEARRMVNLHPEILEKNGRKEFVVLPYEEFLALKELLEDAEDVLELRRAKRRQASAPTRNLRQVKRQLGLGKS
jgi:hypothetical protein